MPQLYIFQHACPHNKTGGRLPSSRGNVRNMNFTGGIFSVKYYNDLHQMVMDDDYVRAYLLSLPVNVQMTIHNENDKMHTRDDFLRYTAKLTKRTSGG